MARGGKWNASREGEQKTRGVFVEQRFVMGVEEEGRGGGAAAPRWPADGSGVVS